METDDADSPLYHTQFTSGKISKVHWTEPETSMPHFITATWNMPVNEISLWSIIDDNVAGGERCREEHKKLIGADVNDFLVCIPDLAVVALNDGTIVSLDYSSGKLVSKNIYRQEHVICRPRVLCAIDNEVFAGCSDGSIIYFNMCESKTSLFSSGLSSIQSMTTSGHSVFTTGHCSGELFLWDVREPKISAEERKPALRFRIGKTHEAVTSITAHPFQPSLIAVGTEHGRVGFLDVRSSSEKSTDCNILSISAGPIWQVKFHPVYPDNLYCSSDDGLLLHCDTSAIADNMTFVEENGSRPSIWLVSTLNRDVRITVLMDELMSMTTFDISMRGIIAGTDSQMIAFYNKSNHVHTGL